MTPLLLALAYAFGFASAKLRWKRGDTAPILNAAMRYQALTIAKLSRQSDYVIDQLFTWQLEQVDRQWRDTLMSEQAHLWSEIKRLRLDNTITKE